MQTAPPSCLHLDMIHQAYQANDKLGQAEQVFVTREHSMPPRVRGRRQNGSWPRFKLLTGLSVVRQTVRTLKPDRENGEISYRQAERMHVQSRSPSTGPLQVGGSTKTAQSTGILQPPMGLLGRAMEGRQCILVRLVYLRYRLTKERVVESLAVRRTMTP